MTISRSILLKMRNVSDTRCRENQNTHFSLTNFFRKSAEYEKIRQKMAGWIESLRIISDKSCEVNSLDVSLTLSLHPAFQKPHVQHNNSGRPTLLLNYLENHKNYGHSTLDKQYVFKTKYIYAVTHNSLIISDDYMFRPITGVIIRSLYT